MNNLDNLFNEAGQEPHLDLLNRLPISRLSNKSLREREKYGISLEDLKNPSQYINFLYATYFRSKKTIESNVMLDCLINANEYFQENTIKNFTNLKELRILSGPHLVEYGELYVEAVKIWPKLYPELFITEYKLNQSLINNMVDALIVDYCFDLEWEDIRDGLPDPTIISSKYYNKHLRQRRQNGYSEWDALIFPDYIHWVVMQTVLFFMSTSSFGTPLHYSENSKLWNDTLRAFLEGMIYGTYAEILSPEQQTIYNTSILNMLDVYPNFIQ